VGRWIKKGPHASIRGEIEIGDMGPYDRDKEGGKSKSGGWGEKGWRGEGVLSSMGRLK